MQLSLLAAGRSRAAALEARLDGHAASLLGQLSQDQDSQLAAALGQILANLKQQGCAPSTPCQAPQLQFRRAQAADWPAIRQLLRDASLPTEDASAHLDRFTVGADATGPVAAGGFEHHGSDALLRSFVLAPKLRGSGHGSSLLRHVLRQSDDAFPSLSRRHPMLSTHLRPASPADAASICAIYNPYVATTAITFEEEAVSAHDMAQRIADVHAAGLPWLVLEVDGKIAGYAYATKWRVRPAYRHSAESTIYLDKAFAGRGLGRALYDALLEELRKRELHMVIGGIALPNESSVGLHEASGFRKAAHFTEVGMKFGRWIDVGYWERKL